MAVPEQVWRASLSAHAAQTVGLVAPGLGGGAQGWVPGSTVQVEGERVGSAGGTVARVGARALAETWDADRFERGQLLTVVPVMAGRKDA